MPTAKKSRSSGCMMPKIETTKKKLMTACEAWREWNDWLRNPESGDPRYSDLLLKMIQTSIEAIADNSHEYNAVRGLIAGFAELSDLAAHEIYERVKPCFIIVDDTDGE